MSPMIGSSIGGGSSRGLCAGEVTKFRGKDNVGEGNGVNSKEGGKLNRDRDSA